MSTSDNWLARLDELGPDLPDEAVKVLHTHLNAIANELGRIRNGEVDPVRKKATREVREFVECVHDKVQEIMVGPVGVPDSAEENEDEQVDPVNAERQELAALWTRLRTDAKAGRYLGDLGEPPEDTEAGWVELALATLRLPAGHRDRWQHQLESVPGRAGPMALLGLSRRTRRHDWAAKLLGERAKDLDEVVGVVGDVMHVLELAGCRKVDFWTSEGLLVPLDGSDAVVKHMESRIKARLTSLAKATVDSAEEIKALVRLDEPIRSVIHRPLPAPDSWWANTISRMERVLQEKSAASGVEIEFLTGDYAMVKDRTDDSDLQYPDSGPAGEVIRALRVWYGGEKLFDDERTGKNLGRVMYRVAPDS